MGNASIRGSGGIGRWAIIPVLLILTLGAGIGLGRGPFAARTPAVGAAQAARLFYTCGMHPQVIQNAPGNCPICGRRARSGGPSASTRRATASWWRRTPSKGRWSKPE